jgi:putative methanogenesis marker protein 17
MDVEVEGGDEFANKSYEKICQDAFREVGIRSSIESVYLYCNPEEHVFIIAAKIGRVSSPVKIWDVTHREGTNLRITNETYAAKLLALLWDTYGEKIQQISRLEISFTLEDKEVEELMDLIVYDPREDLVTRILDGLDRILPEGARVRTSIQAPGCIALIASENPISDVWTKKAQEMVSAHV